MKLIIDTDPGVDDVIAIATAHALPEIDLIGLTAIFGNTFVEQSSRNARYLLDLLDHDAPVAEGRALPYGESKYVPSAEVHGPEGFGKIDEVPQIGANVDQSAAEFLVAKAKEHKGELVICAIGPLTNIADALASDEDFASNVGRLVIMGGAYGVPGNITPHAEANIFHDAKAADLVFASDLNIEMIGLDVTHMTLVKQEDFAALAEKSPKVGGFINEITPFYLKFYKDVADMDGCPMHDAVAVLCCVHPERFTFAQSGLRVSLDQADYGATLSDKDRKSVEIATDIDADWTVSTIERAISALP